MGQNPAWLVLFKAVQAESQRRAPMNTGVGPFSIYSLI